MNELYESVRGVPLKFGADPSTFCSLYAVTIPLFWIGFFVALRCLQEGRPIQLPCAAMTLSAGLSYGYVLTTGHNVPVVVSLTVLLLAAAAVTSLVLQWIALTAQSASMEPLRLQLLKAEVLYLEHRQVLQTAAIRR